MTLKKIAELSGTSVSTVSRVLSDHPRISEKTKERVMKVVRKHGFELNPAARALAGGRTGMIGVLAANIGSGFFAEVIRGIDGITRWQKGHLLCSFATELDDYYRMLNSLGKKGRVDGMILVAPPAEVFSRPLSTTVPMVVVASTPPEENGWEVCDSIIFDNRSVMRDVVDHLLSENCRTIWHAAGPRLNYDALDRRAAFSEAVERHDGLSTRVFDVPYGGDHLRDVLQDLVAKSPDLPDAIIAWNDNTAVTMIEVLKASGHKDAASVKVTGWDDEPIDSIIGLTSVRMPMHLMGENAARLLYERLSPEPRQDPVHQQLDLELVVRSLNRGM